MMPITMFAINEPCEYAKKLRLFEVVFGKRMQVKIGSTYRSENHMQWHRDIEIECIIIGNARYKEHNNQCQIAQKWDLQWLGAEFRSEN